MKKTLKLLSIGNSFSFDAHYFLKDICMVNDFDIDFYNLYIGGCSLETHWDNVKNNTQLYGWYINGKAAEQQISIHDAITLHEYNYITMQQVSTYSGVKETFFPYLTGLIEWVKTKSLAKIFLHQTWAYEQDIKAERFGIYDFSTDKMHSEIDSTYKYISKITGFEIINSGQTIADLRKESVFVPNGDIKLTSADSFHLSIYGRYAAALTWYKFLSNSDSLKACYYPLDADKKAIDLINKVVFK